MKLLADSMLGSLGKWLRLLGYDTAMARDEPDAVLVRQARAEGRVILTRDRQLARRRGVRVLLVLEDDLEAQLDQVATDLDLPPPQPGSRCPDCNEMLVEQQAHQVAGDVPPHVLRTQEGFRRCPVCRRVFWRGTHWQGVAEKLAGWGR